ncbi:hypothetical protein CL633_02210 [bacterium]|nr:hypothetical protein [bacterium]
MILRILAFLCVAVILLIALQGRDITEVWWSRCMIGLIIAVFWSDAIDIVLNRTPRQWWYKEVK